MANCGDEGLALEAGARQAAESAGVLREAGTRLHVWAVVLKRRAELWLLRKVGAAADQLAVAPHSAWIQVICPRAIVTIQRSLLAVL
jgi:hypothetical protein